MPDLSDGVNWSETDANNNNASPNGWPEGMMPSGVNDTGRADRGALKRFWDKVNPVQTITPSGGLWTFTTSNAAYPSAYVNGEIYCFRPGGPSIGGDQFQVNGLGAKPILKHITPGTGGFVPIIAYDILQYVAPQLIYDATLNAGAGAFLLLNPHLPISTDGAGTGVTVPGALAVSGTLTANAGLAIYAGDLLLGRTDQAYAYVLRPNTAGFNNLGFSGPGGVPLNDVIVNTATMEVTGELGAAGYKSRSGVSGPYQVNAFNIQWTGSAAHLWIDNVDLGPIVMSPGGSISIGGDLHQNGYYHYFAGSSGTINTTGGPLIYADANYLYLKLGSGNLGFAIQSYSGGNIFSMDGSGNTIVAGGATVAGTLTANGLVQASGQIYSAANFTTPGAVDCGSVVANGTGTPIYAPNGQVYGAGLATPGNLNVNGSGTFGGNVTANTVTANGGMTIYAVGLNIAAGDLYMGSGNALIEGSLTTAGRLTVNGDWLICNNVAATNDIVANGVFRCQTFGARIECYGGDWNSVSFMMSGGNFNVSGDDGVGGSYFIPSGSYSDARLKDDIRDTKVDALAAILATPVREYAWNEEGRRLMPYMPSEMPCGLVAQDLEETMPIAVGAVAAAGDMKHIHADRLTPYLFRAIQQLAERVSQLETR